MTKTDGSVARVRAILAGAGVDTRVVELPDSTRTVADAARAIGCAEAEIAKSIVFRARTTDRVVLVIASGTNRIDEARIAAQLGEPIGKADAAFVRTRTGFAIGGVPPCGHLEPPVVYVDRDVLGFTSLWAAAGSPHAVFQIAPADLVRLSGGIVIDVC